MYKFDEGLKAELKRPLGRLIRGSRESTEPELLRELSNHRGLVVSIGDMVTDVVVRLGFEPFLSIVDGKVERVQVGDLMRPRHQVRRCKNPQSTISREAYETVRSALSSNQRTLIEVDGEEDLLTLVAIAEAPLGSIVIYGQPKEGVVIVMVNDEIRGVVRSILRRASTSS